MQTAVAQAIGPCWAAVPRMWVKDPAPAMTASTVTGSASATASSAGRRSRAVRASGRPARPGHPDGPSPARSGLAPLLLCRDGGPPR
ncbi:MAG TPA: hypothetical protein VN969_40105 [Streptosporangiaceae bacterium]|nr:hypothetical protein [Streptosporangiaceae bacterium]